MVATHANLVKSPTHADFFYSIVLCKLLNRWEGQEDRHGLPLALSEPGPGNVF